jgi:hypothetical protein
MTLNVPANDSGTTMLGMIPHIAITIDRAAWGRLNVVTPVSSSIGDSHLHRALGAGPITASSLTETESHSLGQ